MRAAGYGTAYFFFFVYLGCWDFGRVGRGCGGSRGMEKGLVWLFGLVWMEGCLEGRALVWLDEYVLIS